VTAVAGAASSLAILALFAFAIWLCFKAWGLKFVPFLAVFLLTFAFARSPLGGPIWDYIVTLPARLGIHVHL
jgi:hypothetical protein